MTQISSEIFRTTDDLITPRREAIMRGISIVMIMLHNMLHIYQSILPECEFQYNGELIDVFFQRLAYGSDYYVYDMISFLGWYGVAFFVFISGYGLTKKYDSPLSQPTPPKHPRDTFSPGRFIIRNWLKLVKLMTLGVAIGTAHIIYSAIRGETPLDWSALTSTLIPLTCLNDLVQIWIPTSPGVYWYFGLAFELYCIYALCVKGRKETLLWVITAVCFALYLILMSYPPVYTSAQIEEYMRHNFIGWMLPFAAGIWLARHPRLPRKLTIAILITSVLLFIPSLSNVYTWQLSPLFAVGIIISAGIISDHIPYWRSFWAWTGRLSAYIFVAHPIVRGLYPYHLAPAIWLTTAYVITVYLAAILYRLITRRLFPQRSTTPKQT